MQLGRLQLSSCSSLSRRSQGLHCPSTPSLSTQVLVVDYDFERETEDGKLSEGSGPVGGKKREWREETSERIALRIPSARTSSWHQCT